MSARKRLQQVKMFAPTWARSWATCHFSKQLEAQGIQTCVQQKYRTPYGSTSAHLPDPQKLQQTQENRVGLIDPVATLAVSGAYQ